MSLYMTLEMTIAYEQGQIIFGEAIFFPSIKDGSLVAPLSGK